MGSRNEDCGCRAKGFGSREGWGTVITDSYQGSRKMLLELANQTFRAGWRPTAEIAGTLIV